MLREIQWSDLPHEQQVGYGHEGLVVKLSETECIKIYSPKKPQNTAELEYKNHQTLLDAGFLVPKPVELVTVVINGEKVMLPSRCEFRGIGLYPTSTIESVPGLIKEFIPGKPCKNKRRILRYIDELHKAGFTFDDTITWDFIKSPNGLF